MHRVPSRLLRSLRTLLRGARSYLFGKYASHRVTGLRLLYRLRTRAVLHMQRQLKRIDQLPQVRIWVDSRAFDRLEKLFRWAQHSIVIQMFIWRDDETGRCIAARLLDCAKRGVEVHITKEAMGDIFELSEDFLSTRSQRHGVWADFWKHPNISVTYAADNNHAKVFVIDDHILLLTGMNIGNEYRYHWHDYLVELRGQQFVRSYLTSGETQTRGPVRLLMSTRQHRIMRRTVIGLLTSARKSIVLEQAYLSDHEVIDTLIQRSTEGIEILLILPSAPDVHYHANMVSVDRLMREGDRLHLRILLFPGMVHGKIILTDQRRAFIGSTNLFRSSLDEMGEVNVLLDGRPKRALRKLKRLLLRDTLRSRSLTDPPSFPIMRRLLAWLSL